MPDIFLSYSRDDQSMARRFVEGFKREGFNVWWDTTLNPGEAFDQVIETALNEAKAVVVLWSRKSVASRWVRAEATHANDHGILVPVMIEPCKRPIIFELIHTADLSHWKGDPNDQRWLAYVAAVRRVVNGEPGPAADSGTIASRSRLTAGTKSFGILAAVVIIAGCALWALERARTEGAAGSAAAPAGIPTPATPTAPRTAIAVMPFANLTGDASKDYLGDGMSEELINVLTKVPGLQVPARTSSFAYKGRNTDIRQIAKDLHVGTILEGSVRAAGKRLRITAQLINSQDGLNLWSDTYDEEFANIFALQDRLATVIVRELRPNLNGTPTESVTQAPPTKDVEAYNLTMQGESLLDPISEDRATHALPLFKAAVARDPKYAHAYADLAWAYLLTSIRSHSDAHIPLAVVAAQQALSLDPNDGRAHTTIATIDMSRSYLASETHWRAALKSAPNDASSHSLYVYQLFYVGHIRAALAQARQAYALAPASGLALNRLAKALSTLGLNAEALRFAGLAVELGVSKGDVAEVYGMAALRAKRYSEVADFLSGSSLEGDNLRFTELIRLIAKALADPSVRPAVVAARNRLFPKDGAQNVGSNDSWQVDECTRSAYGISLLGDQDAAYDLANQCLDESKGNFARAAVAGLGILWTPELRPFRRDSRFHAYMSRIGDLMDYWQQYGAPDECDLKGGRLTCR